MTVLGAVERRPQRADARRNYDKLIAAARQVFTECGADASLETIAKQAGVGIGTLYRNFPTRQSLLEATYLEEVEALCNSASELAGLDPWDALVGWLDRFAEYASTKKALSAELLATLGMDSEVFKSCSSAIFTAGQPLVERAQLAGVVRGDVTINDVVRLASGIAMVRFAEPGQIKRLLAVALDGLRYRPPPTQVVGPTLPAAVEHNEV
jgi:AcrR family transcriptional regulator